MNLKNNQAMWLAWLLATTVLCAYLAYSLLRGNDKTMFMPSQTSHGHHQIEMACSTCHGESFTDEKTVQKSCENCHGEQLKEAKDDHPKKKFTDPRNAQRVEQLDARFCVTCHTEHKPESTQVMGLTIPQDFCFKCHEDIAEDRPSHEGMEFDTCASAGCHNYHDNRALYENFLAKHLHEKKMLEEAVIGLKPNLSEVAELLGQYPLSDHPMTPVNTVDAPEHIEVTEKIKNQWLTTAHAKKGVSCSACHEDSNEIWIDKPNVQVCKTCHENESLGFFQGKHGMRLNEEKLGQVLPPMTVGLARIPMKEKMHEAQVTCSSCHASHSFDIEYAAVEGCLQCHTDEHSVAFKSSPHFELIEKEKTGELPEGSSVTCATCHMPKVEKEYFYGDVVQVLVDHDQSDTLRPNEKMIRPVCMSCHGLGFSIDALADTDLIRKNFSGMPTVHVESLDLAEDRLNNESEK